MEIADSARKHGIQDNDIWWALQHQWRQVSLDDDRVLIIGPNRRGDFLELVVLHPDAEGEAAVIHADALRRKFFRYLQG